MRLALVFDSPKPSGIHSGVAGTYLDRVIDACAREAGVRDLETEDFYAVAAVQPGGKPPKVSEVRLERDRLMRDLEAYAPDRILSIGAGALNALAIDAPKVLAISKNRGRMRKLGLWPWLPTISHAAVIRSSDLHRDFANDVFKVMSQDQPLPDMDIDIRVCRTMAELEAALEALEGASAVGVDVETGGLRPRRDALLTVGIGATYDDTSGLAVVCARELMEEAADTLWDAVWRKSRRSVGHNFKFDMQFLAPLIGWPPDEALIGDTLLLGHLLDERPNRPNSRVRGLGLKDQVAVRYDHEYGFDFSPEGEDGDYTPEQMDAMYTYLADDVVYTARLWHDLWSEAGKESESLQRAHEELLIPITRAIARCEWDGAPVNVAWVEETVEAYGRRIARRQTALENALSRVSTTASPATNILAPAQVQALMYDEWKMTPDIRKHGKLVMGDRSTDKDHLHAAIAKYLGGPLDRQARWLRSLERLRRDIRQQTTYQKSLLDKVDPDGRVRASFLLHGTSTGRLSSQGPNLQNIPSLTRENALTWRPMRRAFEPPEGRLWVEVDYSQLELRVAAALSQDPDFMDVFRGGRDIHAEIAASIFSKPADQVTKGERFMAKAVSFGIIYGRSGQALAGGREMDYAEQKLGMTRWDEQQATAFIKKFLKSYPVLDQWMNTLYQTVPAQGWVESPHGRRRRFPLTPKSRGELGSIQRQAVNTPVQAAASDLCLLAMVDIQRLFDLQATPATVLFPVHDSICIETARSAVDEVEAICRDVMEKDFMGVPLKVDFEYGPNWAEAKEH